MSRFDHFPDKKRDEMTGLPNTRALDEALEVAIATHSGMFALMKIDIFGFKPINDEYGHDEGDEIIKIVADVLDEFLRDNDLHLPVREHGDEFAAILYGVVTKEQLNAVAGRIRAELEEQYGIEVSIGGCLHADDINASQLQALAGAGMRSNRRRRKAEQYSDTPERIMAVYRIAEIALAHSIERRDIPTLIDLVEDGDF